jgi:hypothetical protein
MRVFCVDARVLLAMMQRSYSQLCERCLHPRCVRIPHKTEVMHIVDGSLAIIIAIVSPTEDRLRIYIV